jgi:hypothetical protein
MAALGRKLPLAASLKIAHNSEAPYSYVLRRAPPIGGGRPGRAGAIASHYKRLLSAILLLGPRPKIRAGVCCPKRVNPSRTSERFDSLQTPTVRLGLSTPYSDNRLVRPRPKPDTRRGG